MKQRLAAGLGALLLVASPATAELVAERISEENFAERSVGGPDSIGGVGDWYLANELVEVVVDDASRRFATLNYGGTIVAAGVRGRPGDGQFARLWPIVNLSQRVQLNYDSVRAEVDPQGGHARIVVSSARGMSAIDRGDFIDPLVPDTAEIAQVFPETVYEVRPAEPFVRITTRLANRGERAAPIFAYGDTWMRGGRGPRGFVGDTLAPQHSRGFHHVDFEPDDTLSAVEAMAPATFVAMSGLPPWLPVTYAIASPERVADGLHVFGVSDEHINLMNVFLSDPGWDTLDLIRMLRGIRGEIPAGETFEYARRLVVTPRPDIASATDLLFPMLGYADGSSGVSGSVEPGDVRAVILVETPDGHPITQVTSETSGARAGRYRAVLPPGEYNLVVRAAHREQRRVPISVGAGGFSEAPLQSFEATAFLLFDPAFGDNGAGRVVVRGVDGTPDPRFHAELLDFQIDGETEPSGIEIGELLFADGGPVRVPIAPGRYELTATRGLAYDIEERTLVVPGPGVHVRVAPFSLRPLIELDGVVVADLHVHAQASDDSGMSNEARLKSFLAEHVDVIVSTDHDHVGHYATALEKLGARDRIRVVTGVEVTGSTPSSAAPYTIGHHNAWPVPYLATAHRKGAPPSQEGTLAELYEALRRDYGVRVVQLNHAVDQEGRRKAGAFLSHLGAVGEAFDPRRPLDEPPNRALLERTNGGKTRAIDFDAMEVMNGAKYSQYLRLREVWYALQRQGFRRAATGNSDTHAPAQTAGYPRNYVYTDGRQDPAAFDAAIRDGRLFTTSGPLLAAFRVNGVARMGDTLTASDGRVRVQLAVAAVPWVPVDEVRLLVNGEVVRTFRELAPPEGVLRFEDEVDLEFERDGFITVEAGAPLDVDEERWIAERGGVYASVVAPGMVATAISNPIWIDVDGDGRAQAPGLVGASAADRLPAMAGIVLVLAAIWWWLRARAVRSAQRSRA